MPIYLFFDLDGTLMINPFGSGVFPALLEDIASQCEIKADDILQAMVDENFTRQRENPNHPLTMDWDDIAEKIAKEYGAKISVPVIELVNQFCTAEHIHLLDNADQVLSQLKAENYKLIVASKGLSKYQNPVMKALGIYELFDDFLMPDLTSYIKTDARFFEKYMNDPDLKKNAMYVQIGDHYFDDVICGNKKGFYTILRAPFEELTGSPPLERPYHLQDFADRLLGYPHEKTEIVPDAVIVHLKELPETLKLLAVLYKLKNS